MPQIEYDLKQPIITEDRVIWVKSGPLWSTLSHYTINFSRLCFPALRHYLSEICEHVQNVTMVCDFNSFSAGDVMLRPWSRHCFSAAHVIFRNNQVLMRYVSTGIEQTSRLSVLNELRIGSNGRAQGLTLHVAIKSALLRWTIEVYF